MVYTISSPPSSASTSSSDSWFSFSSNTPTPPFDLRYARGQAPVDLDRALLRANLSSPVNAQKLDRALQKVVRRTWRREIEAKLDIPRRGRKREGSLDRDFVFPGNMASIGAPNPSPGPSNDSTAPQSTHVDQPGPVQPATDLTGSAASHIRTLTALEQRIPAMLSHAATAVGILSTQPTSSPNSNPNNLTDANATFSAAAEGYFSELSAIEVGIRRQVYALEEAGLLKKGSALDKRRGENLNMGMEEVAGGGGMGLLDASVLNARAGTGVEDAKKEELYRHARAWVEGLEKAGTADDDEMTTKD